MEFLENSSVYNFMKRRRNRYRFLYVSVVALIPAGIVYSGDDQDVVLWWLSYVFVAGLIPLIIGAYLLFPAQEKKDRVLKVIHWVDGWIARNINHDIEVPEELSAENNLAKGIVDEVRFAKEMVKEAKEIIEERFHTEKYFFPITFITLVCFVGFFLMFSTVKPLIINPSIDELIFIIPNEVFFGFMGGTLYALYSVVSRYRSTDIPPGLVLQLGYQIIISSAAAYFIVSIIPEDAEIIVAFSVGFVPYADLAEWFRLTASSRLEKAKKVEPDPETVQLKEMEKLTYFRGMAREDCERLREEQIYTYQNLSIANPITLYLLTSFKLSQIVDWINQATLRTFVDSKTFEQLAPMGIHGAVGFYLKSKEILDKDKPNKALIKAIADAMGGVDDAVVCSLAKRLKYEPRVKFLAVLWTEFGSA